MKAVTRSSRSEIRHAVAAHRSRQHAAGNGMLYVYVPTELLSELDRLKGVRGVSSRAPLVEEALREFIERNQAEK